MISGQLFAGLEDFLYLCANKRTKHFINKTTEQKESL